MLIADLEDMVAEARGNSATGRGASRAWVVAEAEAPTVESVGAAAPSGASHVRQGFADAWYSPESHWQAWAMAAAAQQLQHGGAHATGGTADPRKCFGCGKAGHIRRNCPNQRGAPQADSNAELLSAVRELTEMLRSKK